MIAHFAQAVIAPDASEDYAESGPPGYVTEYKNDDLSSDSPRAKVLQEAESLITGDRNASYGTPTQNFQNTADLLNVQFGHKLKERFTATDVAMIMIQLKMARLIASPNKRDNWVDLAGYAACGFETTEET